MVTPAKTRLAAEAETKAATASDKVFPAAATPVGMPDRVGVPPVMGLFDATAMVPHIMRQTRMAMEALASRMSP